MFIPLIIKHLNTLHKKFGGYFQTYGGEWNWIRDPFSVSATETSLPLNAREELVTLRADRALKTKFAEIPLHTFWLSLKSEYPVLCMTPVKILIPFSTTYLCELGFSALRLRAIDEMRVALSGVAQQNRSRYLTDSLQVWKFLIFLLCF
jgi:hypothetical protein